MDASIRQETQQLLTRDDCQLAATLFLPKNPNQHSVIMASAMGIPRRFYRHYAAFLAESGFVVLSFDYRGIGDSRKGSLWGDTTSMADWGARDLQAAIKWLYRQYPENQIALIGHSLGGHLLGLAKANEYVSAFMGIASQNIYWKNWATSQQPAMMLFWHGLLPISTSATGYFPSKIFSMGEAVPKRVAFDWRKAGLNRNGTKGVFAGTDFDHFDKFTGAIRAYSFEGDNLAPRKSVTGLLDFFPNASSKAQIHIHDKRVGHLGFFKPQAAETLWQESRAWLLNPLSQTQAMPLQSLTQVAAFGD